MSATFTSLLKKISLLLLAFGFFVVSSWGQANFSDYRSSGQIKLVKLSGSGYQRGHQHGKQLQKEIAAIIFKWKNTIRQDMKRDADSLIAEFIKATDFKPAILQWTTDLLEEVKGIADAAAQKFNDIYTFQMLDEFWVYEDKLAHHCSSMGIPATDNHPAYVAQNLDIENYTQGFQTVLHIAATKNSPEQFILTCPGLIGANGMNNKGIGLCVNTLMQLSASPKGLPVAFVVRGIIEKQNEKEVLDFVQKVSHASGQNYIIGVGEKVYDFEASANKVVQYKPDENGVVYHTNHPMANDDVKEWYQPYYKKFLAGETKNYNSESRFATLVNRLHKSPDELDDAVIKSTLRSKDSEKDPVCRSWKEGGSGFTFSSVIYTLTGKLSMQVTGDSPDKSDYQTLYFSK